MGADCLTVRMGIAASLAWYHVNFVTSVLQACAAHCMSRSHATAGRRRAHDPCLAKPRGVIACGESFTRDPCPPGKYEFSTPHRRDCPFPESDRQTTSDPDCILRARADAALDLPRRPLMSWQSSPCLAGASPAGTATSRPRPEFGTTIASGRDRGHDWHGLFPAPSLHRDRKSSVSLFLRASTSSTGWMHLAEL